MTKGQTRDYVNSHDFVTWTNRMGGEAHPWGDNGINQTNREVLKYFEMLREYWINRYLWESNNMPWRETNMIEWHLFHRGFVAILKPEFTVAPKVGMYVDDFKVYPCNITRFNHRTFEPLVIDIIILNHEHLPKQPRIRYRLNEFAIISCNNNLHQSVLPPQVMAWEYANKLHELDLAFNANSHKQRIPIAVNSGGKVMAKDKAHPIYNLFEHVGDVLKGALNRNEMIVEIPEEIIGEQGLLHELKSVENQLREITEVKRLLIDEYLEMCGINILREQGGVYQAREVQMTGRDSTSYKSEILLRNRQKYVQHAKAVFPTLDLEVSLGGY